MLTFLPLSYTARPPRLVVVAPGGEEWGRWSAAALGRLSRVWGCSGSVVVPADAVGHPAVERCVRHLQPDHVVAYGPSWATADWVRPGLMDAALGDVESDDRDAAEQALSEHPWDAPIVTEAEKAADALRVRVGANMQVHAHIGHLMDGGDDNRLTPLAAIATEAVAGVPRSLVTAPDVLAYAMQVGVQDVDPLLRPETNQWLRAGAQGLEGPLLSQLHPDTPDVVAALSHTAGRCVAVTRYHEQQQAVVVLGDESEDFALAGLLRQVCGQAVWMPGEVTFSRVLLFLRSGHRPRAVKVTSASLDREEVERRLQACWEGRTFEWLSPAGDSRPFTAVDPDDLSFEGRSVVVLPEVWEQPRSVPAQMFPDGSLNAALAVPAEVPPGLDARKHRWQITLTCADHPVPPLPQLTGDAVLAPGQSHWQTFVRAADGGLTYWSHRFDFVVAGASLAGTLAAPKLAWPGIKKILKDTAATRGCQLQPSAAGKRAAIAERLLGSRTALEELAAGPGWALLRQFLPDAPPRRLPDAPRGGAAVGAGWDMLRRFLPDVSVDLPADEGRWQLKSKTVTVLSWEAVAAHEDPEWTLDARRALVDEWTAQGVLSRGLVLGCEHCPILEFYPLTGITQAYQCRRCGGENTLVQERWRPRGDEPRWFYDLHPAVAELVANNGDAPLLATRFLRNELWARPALVSEEFEILRDGSAIVEMDFAVGTMDGIWLGEAKTVDSLGDTSRERKREVCKLIEGCLAVSASGLVLATTRAAWAETTLQALREEFAGRRKVGKPVPEIRLLSGAGGRGAQCVPL
jgi:hypothetical protein